MERYDLSIADLDFRIETEWHIDIEEKFLPFLTDGSAPWQERMQYFCVEEFPSVASFGPWAHDFCCAILKDGRRCTLRRIAVHADPYMMVIQQDGSRRQFLIRRSSNELPLSMMKVFGGIELEALLLRHDALLLHSAFIRWHGKAILFSAPSGTGKSTQADLWVKYRGAELLNGDRSALRKRQGVWNAFGLPFAGSSDVYIQDHAPIGAIVMLSQAKENALTRLSPVQALRRIYPEFTLHRWDPAFTDKGLNLILELLSAVPIYHLACLPDKCAVELLCDTLTQEMSL